jgi:hypothetical protein
LGRIRGDGGRLDEVDISLEAVVKVEESWLLARDVRGTIFRTFWYTSPFLLNIAANYGRMNPEKKIGLVR